MKLSDLLENILTSCSLEGELTENPEENIAEIVIEDLREPQSLFRLRLNDTSYSDNIVDRLSNNTNTVLCFNYVNINGQLSDVVVTLESRGINLIATAKLITTLDVTSTGVSFK